MFSCAAHRKGWQAYHRRWIAPALKSLSADPITRLIMTRSCQSKTQPSLSFRDVAAFPFDQAPQYLLRDRDRIFGAEFSREVAALGTEEVLGAPRSPWQRAYVERVIGTIRRECLDHVIVFNEASLHRHMTSFLAYYHESRTHVSFGKDTPEARPVQPREREPSLRSRKWAVFTTAMSAAQPECGNLMAKRECDYT